MLAYSLCPPSLVVAIVVVVVVVVVYVLLFQDRLFKDLVC